MELFCILFFITVLINNSSGVIYDLNATEYERMPPVFHLEPYEACLSQPGALYCTLDATLNSDTPSPLLNMIQEYSADQKTHFNHSIISYGLCVTKTCKEYENTTADLRVVLEACLNKTFEERYGLKTRVSENFYCNNDSRNVMDLDTGDFIVAGVLLILVLLNIVGSLYDFYCTSGKPGEGIKFLLCFSIRQNWRKMVQPITDHPDPWMRRLRGCNTIRLLTVVLVIVVHSLLPPTNLIDNPHKAEEMYRLLRNHVLYNGSLVVQTFLVTSAFVHVYKKMVNTKKNSFSWSNLPKSILRRWLRLTPSYAVVLAVTSTWVRYAGSGPLWHKIVLTEVQDCRRGWWLHFVYLNNYNDYNQCMAQTWYLAADMQLFIVGTILYLALKTNRSRKIVLPIFLVIGIILPSLQTYFQDLDGPLLVSPETSRLFFVFDKTFNNVYKRGHTNLAAYVLGMSLGYLVYHWQNTGIDVSKYRKYWYLCWMLLPVAFGILLLGKFFYGPGPTLPLYIRVAYAGLVKPVFALLVCICIAATVFKLEDVARGVLEWNGWTAMSRVSYSAYLLHIFVIRTFAGSQKSLSHTQDTSVMIFVLGTLVITFMCAYPFYLMVESPIAQLVKLVVNQRKVLEEIESPENKDDTVAMFNTRLGKNTCE